jgi:Tol biopolymer transport system component
VWLDRKGERIGTVGKAADYGQIALSPDESRLAVELASDIWTMDLARGVPTRLTSEPGDHIDPVWSPDGRELAFTVYREGQYHLHRKSLAGSEPERPLLELPQSAFPEDWTGGGATLLYITRPPEAGVIWAATPGAEVEPEPLVETPAWIDEPHLSPDGRWLAYTSVDSGQSEVYVGPFRRPGETVRVSPEGGGQPRWRGDGRELFYVTSDGRLMAVTVRAGKERLEFDLPEALFGGVIAAPNRDHYAVTADGQRFLVTVPVDQGEGQHLHVVVNWPSLLESR